MYQKIIIAYDGSEKSQKTLDYAADIAGYHHALLIIIPIMKEKKKLVYKVEEVNY